MKKIKVKTQQRDYTIVVGQKILKNVGTFIDRQGFKGRVCLVTHRSLWDKYGRAVSQSLKAKKIKCVCIFLPEGEKSKSQTYLQKIYQALLDNYFERKDMIVAVGGGVIGDVAGFAAATYLRGIRLVHVPTSLLAQVDSAIGGKTGIDVKEGKNLIGAFYQPHLVVSDVTCLQTIPERDYIAQLGEVVKYGMIWDRQLFEYLEAHVQDIQKRKEAVLEHIVYHCARIKAEVVSRDESETKGLREILNYGHTFAHAFEAVDQYKGLRHGEAVALGMIAAAEVSLKRRRIAGKWVIRQYALLEALRLPLQFKSFQKKANQLLKIMKHDKKVVAGSIRLVLLKRIGKVETLTIPPTLIRSVLEKLAA